jgi:hypothetical protein
MSYGVISTSIPPLIAIGLRLVSLVLQLSVPHSWSVVATLSSNSFMFFFIDAILSSKRIEDKNVGDLPSIWMMMRRIKE